MIFFIRSSNPGNFQLWHEENDWLRCRGLRCLKKNEKHMWIPHFLSTYPRAPNIKVKIAWNSLNSFYQKKFGKFHRRRSQLEISILILNERGRRKKSSTSCYSLTFNLEIFESQKILHGTFLTGHLVFDQNYAILILIFEINGKTFVDWQ